MFIPNQWYGILDAQEVKIGKPLNCRRLGYDLVLWRDNSGQIVALQDRCPHRQAALSAGKVVDGCIECLFHGFRYDAQGDCQLIPANSKNGARPKVFKANPYMVREAYGFIWLWYGELRSQYPAIGLFDQENLQQFTYVTSQRTWPVHYTRVIENQLDLAHPPFVHANSIGIGKLTIVDQLYTSVKNNTLYVWSHQKREDGEPPILSKETFAPTRHWDLCLKYPNVWRIWFGERFRVLQVIAPVDENSTVIYSRLYNNISRFSILQQLIGRLYMPISQLIARQDKRVVTTQQHSIGGLNSGDKYIPADRPIVAYHKYREQLLRNSVLVDRSELPTELPIREHTVEEQLAD